MKWAMAHAPQPIQKIIKRIDEEFSFSVVITFCLEIGFLFPLLLWVRLSGGTNMRQRVLIANWNCVAHLLNDFFIIIMNWCVCVCEREKDLNELIVDTNRPLSQLKEWIWEQKFLGIEIDANERKRPEMNGTSVNLKLISTDHLTQTSARFRSPHTCMRFRTNSGITAKRIANSIDAIGRQ